MKNRALAIGTFDGVHCGHRRLLDALLNLAQDKGLDPMVALFSCSPRIALGRPGGVVRLLTTVQERRDILKEEFGIRKVEVLPQDQRFFSLTAGQFLRRYAVGRWGVRAMVFGGNFAFGVERACRADNFEEFARPLGLMWRRVPLLKNVVPISSSRIRGLLAEGDLAQANRFLGRRYRLIGRVVRGRRIAGKVLGYPTANLIMSSEKLLPLGVFRAWSRDLNRWAVVNIGYRPTFSPSPRGSRPLDIAVEAHILDYKGNLYGRSLMLELAQKFVANAGFNRWMICAFRLDAT